MSYIFPSGSNKTYLQNNRSNVFPIGNLWSTFNIDLQSNIGVLRISPRLKLNYSSVDANQFGIPVAIKFFDGKIFALCDTYIFKNSGTPDNTSWVADGSDSTGSQDGNFEADASDMETFNDTLCATTKTGLYSKAYTGTGAGAWTSRDSLTTGQNHVVCYFKKFDRLYYTNGVDNVLSIGTDWATADPGADYAISLTTQPPQYQINCLRSNSNYVWIGSVNAYNNGGPGKISQWDGISAQVTAEYNLNNAQGCMAIAIDPRSDTPFVMDSNGVLSSFNGSGFTEVGRLPFPFSRLPYNIADTDNEKFIHPNGMYFTKNGTLRCLINNRTTSSSINVAENMPSGVWEWSEKTGFVHVSSASYNPPASSVITDYGQNRVSRVGALVPMNVPNTSNVDGTYMAGLQIYTNASDTLTGIFYDNSKDDVRKKGYFVTDWIESREIADSWDSWKVSFRKFLNANDNIVFKYRVEEEDPVVGTITWVDTTHFTVADSVCVVSNYWTSGTGGEVEILRGTGSGSCVHITNAVLAGGTWTVTVDEAVTGVTTGTATARFQKWIKLFPAENLNSYSTWAQYEIGTDSTPRIQIKGCLTYTGIGEFYKGILTSNEDIKSK